MPSKTKRAGVPAVLGQSPGFRRGAEALAAARPFVKWAGGKARILGDIRSKYPPGLGQSIKKYAEPFVGGGAVLFDILGHYNLDAVYISDINRELMHAYQTVRDNCGALARRLSELESQYLPESESGRNNLYYGSRDRYNALARSGDASLELAALFIFLNKTCFNGLYRVNAKGAFNVPRGDFKKPRICDAGNLMAVSDALRNVRVVCGDYAQSETFIDGGTFAYFDPPYRPLTATSRFTAYSRDGFGDREQMALARFIDRLSARGAYVMASNSDPKNADASDNFLDGLYSRRKIFRVGAGRAINAKGHGRGKINELLIASY